MYKKYRESKEKPSKTPIQKPAPKPKPEWDSSTTDPDKYKLSQAEIVQRKFAFVSKHRTEASEHWQATQEKLRSGVKDSETEKIMETALLAKNLLKKKPRTSVRKREKTSETRRETTVRDEEKKGGLLDKIERNLESTRNFLKNMEKTKGNANKDPSEILRKIERFDTAMENEKEDRGPEKEAKSEVTPYFESLNKIEDTIRFLESNLAVAKGEKPGKLLRKTEKEGALPLKAFLSPEIKKTEAFSSISKEQEFIIPTNEKELSRSFFLSPEPENPPKEELDKKAKNEENAISFDITAKSQTGRDSQQTSPFQSDALIIEKLNPELFFKHLNENLEKDDFLEDDDEKSPEPQNLLGNSEGKAVRASADLKQGPSEFDEIKEKNAKVIFSEIEGVRQSSAGNYSEDEESEKMIEKIKAMMENTRSELGKMNQKSFEFPNYSVLGPTPKPQLEEKENRPDLTNKLLKNTEKKGDFLVKVPRKGGNSETRRQGFEEEDLMPRDYKVVRFEEKKTGSFLGKSFKNTGESLNIRSYLK